MPRLAQGTPDYATLDSLLCDVGARNVLYALAVICRDHANHPSRTTLHAARWMNTATALEATARTLPRNPTTGA